MFERFKRILKPESKRQKVVNKWNCDKGNETLRLFYDLNNNSVVFDVGGYKGQWASEIYSMYNSQIHIFEPLKQYYEYIEKKFSKNRDIYVHKYGLGRINKHEIIKINNDATSLFIKYGSDEKVFIKDIKNFIEDNRIAQIDLIKINIEGGEYDLLERLIEIDFIKNIKNIQIQFHDFVPGAELRMKKIQENLAKTHNLTYQYPFVWENWSKKL